VHRAERGVAVSDRLDTDAERQDVVDLFELALLLLHLAIDGVEVLGATSDLCRVALLGEARSDGTADAFDVAIAILPGARELGGKLFVSVRIEVFEAQIPELTLDALHTEASGERRVDVHRLARDALLRLGLHVVERPHVVEAVAELDQQDAQVLRHRDHHLAEALRLTIFA
jgi:hypothetical protein